MRMRRRWYRVVKAKIIVYHILMYLITTKVGTKGIEVRDVNIQDQNILKGELNNYNIIGRLPILKRYN